MMLMRTDPFRELDRLTERLLGTSAHPAAMPMDAFREGDTFVVQLDLPGVTPESIDLDVERNVLTVRAERRTTPAEGAEMVIAERPAGTFSRQLFLGETLDTERIEAAYDMGVLTLRIPVAEQAKPRRITISGGSDRRQISG
jgi:HSP20 family protein